MVQHNIELWELQDAMKNKFADYKVGDMIFILHDNQLGEPEAYKVLKHSVNGNKILSKQLIINDPPLEFHVSNLGELKRLLENSGSMGSGELGIGDIIYVGDERTTVDLDNSGYEIAVDEAGNKMNNEGNVYGGRKTRKHKRKSRKNKRKTNKRKSHKGKRRSHKRK